MKREEFIKSLADTLKVDAKLLATELNKENDIKFELPKLNSFTDEELSTRDENIKKVGYDEGVTVGFDRSAKKIKDISGVEVEGKDITKIVGAIVSKANTEAKIEPDAKLQDALDSITKLQGTISSLEGERDKAVGDFQSFKQRQTILAAIPQNTVGLSSETILTEMQAQGYSFTEEGVHLNGDLVKDDKMQNPIPMVDVFNQFMTDKNWLKKSKPGRGGDDTAGATPVNYKQFIEQCEKDGINPAGEEAIARAKELAMDNPEFYD
ncbi:hypothetical protein BTO06_09825 [Tenacibaculum sp. SZ-18]|uniref:hypothetical protein n=1 Tax=Tenacibaculum sp. SZ-18 TaxID=754423 RepID=UPI000C2D167E|nr:hypothetical protein [Tenacibaculum sp. SZ-18]AUC15418.1 hypothetical protein BTO06_09825 [Tenacibaculum sp. SZ-18]